MYCLSIKPFTILEKYVDWIALSFDKKYIIQKDYVDWTKLSFDQNFIKEKMGLTVLSFDKKNYKKTIWSEPFCLLTKIFSENKLVCTILSFDQ